MTLTACLDCGEACTGPRCPEHTLDPKPDAATRGYDAAWKQLSKRARRLQPWCDNCGATEDLQADHSAEAWARKAAGKSIRLQDVQVLCGPCNRAAGAARGPQTRGDAPTQPQGHPGGRQSLNNSRSFRGAC